MAKKPPATSDDAPKAAAPAADSAAEKQPAGEKAPGEKAPRKKKTATAKPAAEKLPSPVTAEQRPAAPGPVQPAGPAAKSPQADGQAQRKKKPGAAPSRGKKLKNHLRNIQQKLLKDGPQPLKKAVVTLKSLKRSKMDETVEIHIFLGVDPTQSDQLIRGTVSLPNGIGKSVRVLVFCQADNVAKAKAAGADFAGGTEIIEKIQKENWLDFDVALATQDMMGQVSRLGKVLGPRGLMPTPKAGTVVSMSQDIGQIVKEFKAGKVEYRTDKTGNVHARVGKMSFDEDKLTENIQVFVDTIKAARPSSVKGHFIISTTISATQSPGIKLAV
jgi:large subunit ribosomal protein L1